MTTLPADWSDWGLFDASLDWQDAALCAQVGGDWWHPDQGESTREAKRVCLTCPVRAECLAYALANESAGTDFGVWGGLGPRERRKLKRGDVVVLPARPEPAPVAVPEPPVRKVCTRCKTEKPLAAFYASQGGSWCMECRRADRRARHAERRDRAGAA